MRRLWWYGPMTYPEPSVITMVQRDFAPVHINVLQDSAKPLIERFRQIWTPDIRILVGEGEAYLRMQDFDCASSLFEEVVRVFPVGDSGPEAQFLLAVPA